MSKFYCQPVFIKGAGLGTRLFPWAKCKLFSHQNQVPMLYPQWVQPRLGPLVRGGIDLKCYANQILLWNLFQKQEKEIGGIKRLNILRSAKRQRATADFDLSDISLASDILIEFALDDSYFQSFHNFDQFLLRELRAMTKAHWLQVADKEQDVPIGINVRLGNDFKAAQTNEDYFTKGAIKTPVPWFIESLQQIRKILGFCAPAYVVSDGTEKELRGLLDMENVFFIRPGCAISDLLLLSRAKVFIASGGSSFSAWASFLGQMPTISHPGQPLTWFKINNRKGHYVGEFDPSAPAELFIDDLKRLHINFS